MNRGLRLARCAIFLGVATIWFGCASPPTFTRCPAPPPDGLLLTFGKSVDVLPLDTGQAQNFVADVPGPGRLQIAEPAAADDAEKVFVGEAAALCQALAGTDRRGTNLAASVAEAISGALARRGD